MALAPFQWGAGGQAVSPDQLARARKVAEALRATQQNPDTMWEGIQSAIGQVGGSLLDARADTQEKEARDAYGSSYNALGDAPTREQLLSLAGNEFGSPGQQAVVQALLNQQLDESDPDTALDRQYKQAQIDALGAKESAKAPDVAEFYDAETGQPYKATWNAETGQYERVGGIKAPPPPNGTQLVSDGEGGFTFQQGDVAAMPKLTEGQSKDAVFVTRASGALPTVDALGDKLTSLPENAANLAGPLKGYFQSEEYQKADNAGREFIAAILRKDSGAAITEPEMQNYGGIYLPQPGDKPGLLAQKKAARQRAVKAIALGLPPAAILALEQEGVTIPELPGTDATAAQTKFPGVTIKALPD